MSDRNWREVTLETGTVWDKAKPIEGIYLGVEESIGPNKSNMYTIDVSGSEVKVWGSTVLDDKLKSIDIGAYVKIEYEGKLKSKKGSEYHSYKVFVDDKDPDADEPEQEKAQDGGDDEPIDLNNIPF